MSSRAARKRRIREESAAPRPLASTNTNTCWVLVAGKADPRHLSDIIFGVHALRRRGVPDTSIWVFADHPAVSQHFRPYGISNVFPVREFTTRLPQLPRSELIAVIASGHGEYGGICVENGPPINATQLLTTVRASPGIKGGIIVLGQCYAGLFNYTNAGVDPEAVHLCLIGATSLNASLSSPITLPAPLPTNDGSAGLADWTANVFVVRFFEWLLNPQDIDGDGRCTLMDAYKYASVLTNDDQVGRKGFNHYLVGLLQPEVLKLEESLKGETDSKTIQALTLELNAKRQRLGEVLQNLYTHQESWVLHARFASAIEFLPPRPAASTAPADTPDAGSPGLTKTPAAA